MPAEAAGLQLQRRLEGGHRGLRSNPAGRPDADRGDEQQPGPARAAGPARGWWATWSPGSLAATVEEDPAVHYYVPCIPMKKQELIAAMQGAWAALGVRGVQRALAGGVEDPASKIRPSPRSSTPFGPANTRMSATHASSMTGCTATSRRTAPSPWCPRCPAASATPDELMRIASAAVKKYNVPLVKLTGGQRIDLVGVSQGGPAEASGADHRHAGRARLGQKLSHLQELHRHRVTAASAWATAWDWRRRSRSGSAASTARPS